MQQLNQDEINSAKPKAIARFSVHKVASNQLDESVSDSRLNLIKAGNIHI